MVKEGPLLIHNGERVLLNDIPVYSFSQFKNKILFDINAGGRLVSFFGYPLTHEIVRLFSVVAYDTAGKLFLKATDVKDRYPSLTSDCAQFHWFEREIAEQWGVIPENHPWLKPIRFHQSYRYGYDAWQRICEQAVYPGQTDFFQMRGEEVHEVAVGPVHAGIIEPGHFRFQCHGEKVYNLEISLGYQYRGIEPALRNGLPKRALHYMETAAGDTTIGHTIAYCQALESLMSVQVSPRAETLRAVMLELERLANHVGDLGALANDVAYLPTASYCGRLRGDFLNMSALVCGNRFGRGMMRPGGVFFDVDDAVVQELLERLQTAASDVAAAVNLLWTDSSVVDRFERTGVLGRETCEQLGVVGVAARACGIGRDVRFDFPFGMYRFYQIPVSTYHTGDVFARAYVRWLEIQRSIDFIQHQLKALPQGQIQVKPGPCIPDALTVSLVEGWRGEICHVMITDNKGALSHYKITDPSFHNWMGLSMVLRNEEISNFPLCNKSFNLSYCGHDL